jgi:hypothetical protein
MSGSPEESGTSATGERTATGDAEQTVGVQIVDTDGTPLADGVVNIRADGFAECTETSGAGACSVTVPEEFDAVRLFARSEGHYASSRTVELEEEQSVTMELPAAEDISH